MLGALMKRTGILPQLVCWQRGYQMLGAFMIRTGILPRLVWWQRGNQMLGAFLRITGVLPQLVCWQRGHQMLGAFKKITGILPQLVCWQRGNQMSRAFMKRTGILQTISLLMNTTRDSFLPNFHKIIQELYFFHYTFPRHEALHNRRNVALIFAVISNQVNFGKTGRLLLSRMKLES